MAKVRLYHTSDWHLGKKLFQKERTQEQELFLSWLLEELQSNQIDYLIIAGDIFDVPNPPNSALKIFYDFIYKLGKLPNLKTIVIGGNHDSSSLLQIPQSFFSDINCQIFTGLDNELSKMTFYDELRGINFGFKTLPYFKNYELVNQLSQHNMTDYLEEGPEKIEKFFKDFFSTWQKDCDFKFLISHHSFGHSEMSGSEQAIYLSGVESFPLEWIKEYFDYTALGHIHKKTVLSHEPPIIYPGSPIPMRFSESNDKHLIDIIIENDKLSWSEKEIPRFRELIQFKGQKDEVLSKIDQYSPQPDNEHQLKSYAEVIIELEEAQSGLADKIKDILKNKDIEMLSYMPIYNSVSHTKNLQQKDLNGLSLNEIFKKYYEYKYETSDVPDKIMHNFNELMLEINNEDS